MPEDKRPPAARHLRLLAEGDIEVVGRLPWSSNHTFLATCVLGDEETRLGALDTSRSEVSDLYSFEEPAAPTPIRTRAVSDDRAVSPSSVTF